MLIDLADLERTGLLKFGSRARRMVMVKAPAAAVDPIVRAVNGEFQEQFVNARSFRGNEDQIGTDLDRAENYLSLVGFIIVILGGIGVWSVTRVFVQQKLRAIAVLKCLGASTRQVLAVYVAQVLALGAMGSLLGLLIAWAALAAIPPDALAALGGAVPHLTRSAVLQGTTVGLLVSLLFSLVPLLDIRRVKPLLLLRDEAARGDSGRPVRRTSLVARRGLDQGRGRRAWCCWRWSGWRAGRRPRCVSGASSRVRSSASRWCCTWPACCSCAS